MSTPLCVSLSSRRLPLYAYKYGILLRIILFLITMQYQTSNRLWFAGRRHFPASNYRGWLVCKFIDGLLVVVLILVVALLLAVTPLLAVILLLVVSIILSLTPLYQQSTCPLSESYT